MGKRNRGKGSGRSSSGKREIKQVFIAEDGSEESVSSQIIESDSDSYDTPDSYDTSDEAGEIVAAKETTEDSAQETSEEIELIDTNRDDENAGEEISHRVHSKIRERKRPGRVAAIVIAMAFSLILSMCVGGGLALWDSERSLADLNDALFNKNVYASVNEDGQGVDTSDWETIQDGEADEVPGDDVNEAAEDAASTDTEEVVASTETNTADTAEESDEFLATSEISGLDTLIKAGSGDEISISDTLPAQNTGGNPNANYPLPFTTVDESYFTDALFIGDSRLQGFGMWSGVPATFYCATGFSLFKYETANVVQTENGKVPIFDALPYDAFTKIYIKVGLNEMGWDNEKQFEEKYAELIAKLREYEPRAIIYVHGVLPVTAAKSSSDKAHNNPNILVRNEALQNFAASQQAYYIDAGPALSDENGCLRSEMTSDGIHLAAQYMTLWKQFLCEHAVVVR